MDTWSEILLGDIAKTLKRFVYEIFYVLNITYFVALSLFERAFYD
jgi:hypothetical protein